MPDIELYEFQEEDVQKLLPQTGRLNCSDMGTGKTFEGVVLDYRTVESNTSNSLLIAPKQTLGNWVEKFSWQGVPTVLIDPKNRDASLSQFKRMHGGVFIMHWDALRLMPELREFKWEHIIADEVHRAQNRKAQQTIALKRLRSNYKTGLSGTPVTTHIDKYWSVLNWLYPNQFSSYWKFFEQYIDYEIDYNAKGNYRKIKGPKNEAELNELIAPFFVRHLKKEQCCPHHPEGVMPWLPDKYYSTVEVDLLPQQRKAYRDMKEDMMAWVGAHEHQMVIAPVVVAQMVRLQQFAVAYAETGPSGEILLSEPSSKLDAVMEIVEDNPDQPIVVFSQFKQLLYLLAKRLEKAKEPVSMFTGDNPNTRDVDKERFIKGQTRFFLSTIGAGGVGVDGLQEACNTAIFVDRSWSPPINKQAEDRLWRDGQKNAVQIIDIIARNTIDLGRMQRLEETWSWIKRLLGDT